MINPPLHHSFQISFVNVNMHIFKFGVATRQKLMMFCIFDIEPSVTFLDFDGREVFQTIIRFHKALNIALKSYGHLCFVIFGF